MNIQLHLNGSMVSAEAPADISLLHLLRDYLGITGPRKAAGSANAAPARCSWTAGWSTPAWRWPPRLTAATSSPSRASAERMAARTTSSRLSSTTARSNAATASPAWCWRAKRCWRKPRPTPRPDPRGDLGQPVPLHGLPADRGRHPGHGGQRGAARRQEWPMPEFQFIGKPAERVDALEKVLGHRQIHRRLPPAGDARGPRPAQRPCRTRASPGWMFPRR